MTTEASPYQSPAIEPKHWFYGENGVQQGPVGEQELHQLIALGRIHAGTLLWREGMSAWLPLDQLRANGSIGLAPAAYIPYSAPPTSGLAICSLVCGICGLVTCLLIPGIPAVICGHMALSTIAKSPVPIAGRGLAIAGLVTGYLAVLGLAGFVFFWITAFASLAV